jgi:hypothetical protein
MQTPPARIGATPSGAPPWTTLLPFPARRHWTPPASSGIAAQMALALPETVAELTEEDAWAAVRLKIAALARSEGASPRQAIAPFEARGLADVAWTPRAVADPVRALTDCGTFRSLVAPLFATLPEPTRPGPPIDETTLDGMAGALILRL